MNLRQLSVAVKQAYKKQEGVRFFTERALLSALLEKNGLDRNALLLHPEQPLSAETEQQILSDLQKLLRGEPIQYYLGTEYFCGLEFRVAPGVLIPRPETELLVELGRQYAPKNGLVFDFCCGSGCVGIALLSQREDLSCISFDVSEQALKLTKENTERFSLQGRLRVKKADVLSCGMQTLLDKKRPSLVLANPPYLTSQEMLEIPENVAREPRLALDGGEDGLLFYRVFTHLCQKSGIPFLCEIGKDQKAGIEKMLSERGLRSVFYRDFSGFDRAFYME